MSDANGFAELNISSAPERWSVTQATAIGGVLGGCWDLLTSIGASDPLAILVAGFLGAAVVGMSIGGIAAALRNAIAGAR